MRRNRLVSKFIVLHDDADGPLHGLGAGRSPGERGRTDVAGHVVHTAGQVADGPVDARGVQGVVAVQQRQFSGEFSLVRVPEGVIQVGQGWEEGSW